MDGRDLRFLDNAFSAATAFFTLMYITPTDHGRVFNEVFRVLQNGAPFFVWDVALPLQEDREGDFAVFPLVVRLPGEAISTGYGARWPEEVVDLDHYDRLARSTGFEVVATESDGRLLRLHLRKPDPGGP